MSQILTHSLPEHLKARQTATRRDWGIQALSLALAVGALVGAGAVMRPINTIRQERQYVIDPESMTGLPPDLALLGKLGTFRALAIDWASWRAMRLSDEGKTYEALELHKMVCKLAPRFPTVWVHAAWNMAYNISVLKYTPEQRWQWVSNGIKLLRDEAMKYNPKSVTLYKELSYIYWHKLGDVLDDYHRSYKRALAVEMERTLGAPPVTVSDAEYFDWFRNIVEAPRDLAKFLARDPQVAGLVEALAQVDLGPDETLLEFVARNFRPELRREDLVQEGTDADPLLVRRLEILQDPEQAEPFERLLAAVRSDVLRRRHRFDLDWMMRNMEQYGPLDWRSPFTHALYWASYGDHISRGHENRNINDAINTARQILMTLQAIIMRGRTVLYPDFDDPFNSYLDVSVDTRFIPYLFDAYLKLGKDFFSDHPDFKKGTPGPNFMTGMVTAMENWIQMLYLEGGERNMELAENYYAWLRENNPHPDGSTQSRYLTTLDQFVMGDILTQLHTHRAAHGFITTLVQRGLKHLSLGQKRAGVTCIERAGRCREYWLKDADVARNERMMMQPLAVIVRDQIEEFFKSPRVRPLFKINLWKNLGPRQQLSVYDRLLPYAERICAEQEPPWDVNVAFPKPPGLEEYRKQEQRLIDPARQEGVEQGEHVK